MIRCVLKRNDKYLNGENGWGSFSRARIFFSKKEATEKSEQVGGEVEEVILGLRRNRFQKKPETVFVAHYVCQVTEDKIIATGDFDAVLSAAKEFMSVTEESKIGFGYVLLPDWPNAHRAYGNKWGERVVINKMEYLK